MSIAIVHTAAEGTLVHGTRRGDGTNIILKTAGFRWFRSQGLWGITGSRDHEPDLGKIERAVAGLRGAGHTVAVHVEKSQVSAVDA